MRRIGVVRALPGLGDLLCAVPALRALAVVLHRSHRNWQVDRFDLLSDAHRRLPRVVLEHDPPRASPTDTRHPVDDPEAVLVHVTPFNELMWDAGRTPTTVVEHGVLVRPGLRATGELPRGGIERFVRDWTAVFERVRRPQLSQVSRSDAP